MSRILLIEDDPVIGRALSLALESKGHAISWERDLASARAAVARPGFDLALLDLNLPDGDGLDFLRDLRKSGAMIPVIILTARTDESSVVRGFESGANDYVRKPFGNAELEARVNAVLRGPGAVASKRIEVGDLALALEERQAFVGDREVDLTRREFDILVFLAQRAERVVSRADLVQLIDADGAIFDRTVDSHVSHIRSRLRAAGALNVAIKSEYGVGYRLERGS